ncbi:acetyl-CoA carboxylase biotin carboxyl carrier protein [Oenococcus alcoholitolerans]|uniref:acetyl-CoA carboxylase biotin carboxyl carrier protein n=1 Tax=Oenococcus alcoholitolerans TaxID=931074 RepID=UPI000A741E8A
MDEKAIKELIDQIDHSSIRELDLTLDGLSIHLSKNNVSQPKAPATQTKDPKSEPAEEAVRQKSDQTADNSSNDQPNESKTADDDFKTVDSPLVGVAYLQPKPDAPAYVKVGDRVQSGQVVCVIEAMKMMTEIKSDISGIVDEILVDNESMVDYGQPLIKIKEEN